MQKNRKQCVYLCCQFVEVIMKNQTLFCVAILPGEDILYGVTRYMTGLVSYKRLRSPFRCRRTQRVKYLGGYSIRILATRGVQEGPICQKSVNHFVTLCPPPKNQIECHCVIRSKTLSQLRERFNSIIEIRPVESKTTR